MNFPALVKELKFFAGYRILITIQTPKHRTYHGQYCTKVQYLVLAQRTPEQGNVILCNSLITKDQIPHGITFWAKNVHHVTWHHPNIAELQLSNKIVVTITRLWKLTDRPYEELFNEQDNLLQSRARRRSRAIQHLLGRPDR